MVSRSTSLRTLTPHGNLPRIGFRGKFGTLVSVERVCVRVEVCVDPSVGLSFRSLRASLVTELNRLCYGVE